MRDVLVKQSYLGESLAQAIGKLCPHFPRFLTRDFMWVAKCAHSTTPLVGRYTEFFELMPANNRWLKPHVEGSDGGSGWV